MDKAITKLIAVMMIIFAYPSYAVDYEYCSKLMEIKNATQQSLAKSMTEEINDIKVPSTLCKEEKTKEEEYTCEYKWQKMYISNTQKPKGSVFNLGNMLFYTTKSKYWNEKLIKITDQLKDNKCP